MLIWLRFADVHYYFDNPASEPLHHRFNRGSYLYLYLNATQRRGRVEVANNPGTPDQDACNGCEFYLCLLSLQRPRLRLTLTPTDLDVAAVKNTFKQPNLFTITVDGPSQTPNSSRSADHSQWHLPAYDLKNEHKYLYHVHSMDVYLWTTDDAMLFLDSAKRALASHQLQFAEAVSPAEHDDSMSSVVQQLEKVAISSPRPSLAGAPSVPPPASNSSPSPVIPTPLATPAPYNPAAPAAPEPIAHREKTPPPDDGANGTGLATAAAHDHAVTFASVPLQYGLYEQTLQSSYFPGPPHGAQAYSSPLPSASFPPPPPGISPAQTQHQRPQSYSQPRHSFASSSQYAGYPSPFTPMQSPGITNTAYPSHQPLQSPGFVMHTPLQSPGFLPPPPPQSAAPAPPAPPIGGYSKYSYGSAAAQPPAAGADIYGMHAQLYRPTESEMYSHASKPAGKPDKFNERIGRVEKGVGKWLKRLDK